MAEYITKEAAIEVFEWGDADVIEDYGDGGDFGLSRGAIKSAINSIPTADVVPVVRCKDCYQSVVIGNVLHCTYWAKDTDENGYCHEGG